MWTTTKSAGPPAADAPRAVRRGGNPEEMAAGVLRRRRRLAVLTGVALGYALAQLAGTLLYGELQPLRFLFIPLSMLAGGVAALGAWNHFAALAEGPREALRRRSTMALLAGLALGTVLLVGLYQRFAVRVEFGPGRARSIAYLVGWSRSEQCNCPADDASCIKAMGLDAALFRPCWNGRWAVDTALALSYLLTLGACGALGGLLLARRLPPTAPAAGPDYLDFDVRIDQKDGSYRAEVRSRAGYEVTESSFILPPALAGAEPCRFGFAADRGDAPGWEGAATESSPEMVGGELFRALFQGEVLKAFEGCLAKSADRSGLRIRLRLKDVPELARLPWEYLFQADGRHFLALSPRTPVVRYLELNEPLEKLAVEPPLRVLAVISTPKDYEPLPAADQEWQLLCRALARLPGGQIEVERLEPPTHAALEQRLRTGGPFHILHFIGHGHFSELRREGVLIFEDETGKEGVPVGAKYLASLLRDHPSLRLALLNACNGARASREDTFAGTAQLLVQHGVPAVIGMQSKVTDATACSFAERFYRALADRLPVDACVGEVRRSLEADGNPEWGTPVLYLRATDGRLFDVEKGNRAT
jgi:CHAT domain